MNNIDKIIKIVDEKIKQDGIFKEIDNLENFYSELILSTFKKFKVSRSDFNGTTGYGYNDIGRDKIDEIFAVILDSEKALVRSQFISGTHALTVTMFGLLRPNDTLLSITGKPYDTLDEVIGIKENPSSLKAFNINYEQIDLVNNDFDYEKIQYYLENKSYKVITIQRSRGYSTRKSISVEQIGRVVKLIKKIQKDVIVMVDNCYCEMLDYNTPTSKDIGCDIMVGSLIKNLGGGIAPNGAYVAGRADLVNLIAERLTVPGQGSEVGPSLDINKLFLQGLYMAPSVVASSLKTNVFASCLLEELGYQVDPIFNEPKHDIVLNITFNNKEKLIKFIQGIQDMSAIDNFVKPIPAPMIGYTDEIIMASGSFIQGSSIEISCDGPIKPPYIAYLQGALTYQYGRLAVINAVKGLLNNEEE